MTIARLNTQKLEELKHVIQQDYGVILSDAEAEQFGLSLLRVTRLAMGAFNSAEEKRSMAST